jgi:ABC-2 type transport system ATP-binding protein
MTATAVETIGLGKRYGTRWALSECTLEIPAGSVTALVGPNGAGKTTLLHLAIGLTTPTAGTVEVFGQSPRRDAGKVLPRLGFVAQDHPLYRNLTIAETFKLGRKLNPNWNDAIALARVERLGLNRKQKVGQLSGGQQAQVALTLALAKRPELLLLDEPVAALDPLARRHFLGTLAEAVAESGLTVVLSSHLVADIERVCDHLILLSASRVQLCGDIEDLLATHRLFAGPRKDTSAIERNHTVVQVDRTPRQTTMLVRLNGPLADPEWEAAEISLEELVLGYMGADAAPAVSHLAAAGDSR